MSKKATARPPFPQEYKCGVPFPLNDKVAVEAAAAVLRKHREQIGMPNAKGLWPHHAADLAMAVCPTDGNLVCDYTGADSTDYWTWLFREVWMAGWRAALGQEQPPYCDPEDRGCNEDYCLSRKYPPGRFGLGPSSS